MHRKLVFVLAMFAVAIGSLSQAQAALASPRPPGSIATHSATGAVRAAAATRQMAHGARLRTEEKQGSRPRAGTGERRKRPRRGERGGRGREYGKPIVRGSRQSHTVDQVCQITSTAVATFVVGQAGTFTVTTTGYPTCILPPPLTLPPGVTFTDNKNGTATLAGTPAANTAGTYQFTINATNNVIPDATQNFTLTVNQAPGITSADHTTCTAGKACAFTVKSTGAPAPGLSEKGALPRGVTFKDNGDGTATLAGTPAAGSGGTYPFRITATNVAGSDTQSFTLTVVGPPAAPSGLKATGKGKTVSLTWKNNASAPSVATAILIQRSTNAGFTTAVISTTVGPAVTTHVDAAVVKGKKYYYRVRAHNTVGDSAWSNVSNVTAP